MADGDRGLRAMEASEAGSLPDTKEGSTGGREQSDPHDLAVSYIDGSIADQVALGYDAPTAERRLAAIAGAERALWNLRRLTTDAC